MSHTYCFHQEMKICFPYHRFFTPRPLYLFWNKSNHFWDDSKLWAKSPNSEHIITFGVHFFTSHHPVWSGTLSRNSNILDGKMHYVPDWQQRCFDDVNHCYVQLFMHRNDGLFTRLQEGQSKDLTLFESRWGAESDPLIVYLRVSKKQWEVFCLLFLHMRLLKV